METGEAQKESLRVQKDHRPVGAEVPSAKGSISEPIVPVATWCPS